MRLCTYIYSYHMHTIGCECTLFHLECAYTMVSMLSTMMTNPGTSYSIIEVQLFIRSLYINKGKIAATAHVYINHV